LNEVEFLQQGIEIPSFSGNEAEFGDFLYNKMAGLGFKVEKDSSGNIIGQIGKGRPDLLLSSHMDTVIGTIPVKVSGDNIYGRGAIDAKGCLISMVCAAARFIGKNILGKVIVAGIVEEESSLKGITSLLQTLEKPDFAIFGEPSGIDRICTACKGRLHLHLTVRTNLGSLHVSSSNGNLNAIHEAINFWQQLNNRMQEKPFQGKTPYFSVEPNITLMQGGAATNILPDTCTLDIDLRFPPGLNSTQILSTIDTIIQGLQTQSGVQISYEVLSQIEGFRAEKETNLVNALKSAIEQITNAEAKFLRKSGTNFMALIGNKWQIPVVSYGPGDPSVEHTPREHINIGEFQKTIDVLERFISIVLIG
jgi:LysW-gamma-L-lysine carboxypeptidase